VYDQKALQPTIGYPAAHDYVIVGKTIGAGKYHSLFLSGGGSYLTFVVDPSDLVGVWTDGLHQEVGLTAIDNGRIIRHEPCVGKCGKWLRMRIAYYY
jgi:hypothetical protein